MGRRKIEIQPITHERNRSVTFLKRKNGLFKKAYELGVLCSVDVTVIIFEKAGTHSEKLYEYCSATNSDAQVAKRLDWEGDRDTRGPSDFGGDKQSHPGLLVPSSGQEGYDDDDGDGDGDSAEDIKDVKQQRIMGSSKKGGISPKDRRSSAEEAPRHSLSHPSLAAPISTYHLPGASHPVSDQRFAPHLHSPHTLAPHPPQSLSGHPGQHHPHHQVHAHLQPHPNKRPRTGSSATPTGSMPTPILPLVAQTPTPGFNPYPGGPGAPGGSSAGDDYRALFGLPGPGLSGIQGFGGQGGGGGGGGYQGPTSPPGGQGGTAAFRRPSSASVASSYHGGGGGNSHGQYGGQMSGYGAHGGHGMFSTGHGPFASLLAASGAGSGGPGGGGTGQGPPGGGGAFDLEWPVHTNAPSSNHTSSAGPGNNSAGGGSNSAASSVHGHHTNPTPPHRPASQAASVGHQQQQNGTHPSPNPSNTSAGNANNPTAEEGGDHDPATWLDYLGTMPRPTGEGPGGGDGEEGSEKGGEKKRKREGE